MREKTAQSVEGNEREVSEPGRNQQGAEHVQTRDE
jgi:hypothetical protein